MNVIKKEGKYRNPGKVVQPDILQNPGILWRFLTEKGERTPLHKISVETPDMSLFSSDSENALNVTWLGHSSLMINLNGYKILTDPVYEDKISFFGPSRYNGSVPADYRNFPAIDAVLISHNHYDHLNEFTIKAIKHKVKKFIVPHGIKSLLISWGVKNENITEGTWWEEKILDEKLKVTFTPAQHFSGRGIFDRDKSLWTSFVIQSGEKKIFFGGDSGYFEGFRIIGEKLGPFDLVFLECGAYDVNWPSIHMFPEQTVQAFIDLKGKILFPIHWGTFNLAFHPWNEPMKRLTAEAEKTGTEYVTPRPGETADISAGQYINSPWWVS